jgi:hypothetical protein
MLTNIDAFTIGKEDKTKREEIYKAYRQLWLYGSDETIQAINKFWISQMGEPPKEEQRTDADRRHGEMVLQLRKDFYGKTNLKSEDYYLLLFK